MSWSIWSNKRFSAEHNRFGIEVFSMFAGVLYKRKIFHIFSLFLIVNIYASAKTPSLNENCELVETNFEAQQYNVALVLLKRCFANKNSFKPWTLLIRRGIQDIHDGNTKKTKELALFLFNHNLFEKEYYSLLATDYIEEELIVLGTFFEALLKDSEFTRLARIYLSQIRSRQNRGPEALSLLEKNLKEYTNQIDSQFMLGVVSARMGDNKLAIPHLKATVTLQPNHSQALALLFDLERESGNYKNAYEYLAKLQAFEPGNRQNEIRKINLLIAEENYIEAKEVIAALVNTKTLSVEETVQISDSQQQMLLYNSAKRTLNSGLSKFEDNEDLLFALIKLYLLENNTRLAKDLLYKEIVNIDDKPRFKFLQGRIYEQSGNLVTALRIYKELLVLAPESNILLTRLYDLSQSGMPDNAVLNVIYARLTKNRSDYFARTLLAQIFAGNGQTTEAIEQYTRLLILTPMEERADIMSRLSFLYEIQGNTKLENDFARKAFERDSNKPFTLARYGWSLVKTGNIERGLEFLLQSVNNGLRDADTFYQIGYAYHKLGKLREAELQLRQSMIYEKQGIHRESTEILLAEIEKSAM